MPSAPAESMRALLLSELPAGVLSAMIAKALDPAVATDSAWDELIAATQFRAEKIARDISHLQDLPAPHNDQTEVPSPEKEARMASFRRIFSLQGEPARIAARRLAQTFFSEQWLAWSPYGTQLLLPLAREQKQANAPLDLFLRQWLIEEYVNRQDSKNGSLALAECLRLGALNRLLEGEILEDVLRQHARWKPDPWNPAVVAAVEAIALQREVAQTQAGPGLSPDSASTDAPGGALRL